MQLISILVVVLSFALMSEAFRPTRFASTIMPASHSLRSKGMVLRASDSDSKTNNNEVTDLNLEEMFDVFEAAERGDSLGDEKKKAVTEGDGDKEKKSFPDFADPNDWITIVLSGIIIKTGIEIVSRFLGR
jgi:hypothetical protein